MGTSTTDQFDNVLLNIASKCGGIEGMLQMFFGFLHRRTDFYAVIPTDVKSAQMGFRPGVAELMLLRAFRKYPFRDLQGRPIEPAPAKVKVKKAPKATPSRQREVSEAPKREESSNTETSIDTNIETRVESLQLNTENSEDAKDAKVATPLPEQLPAVQSNEKGLQIPISNGGIGDSYYWQQTDADLTVYVQFPMKTPARDVVCAFQSSGLSVGCKGKPPILQGTFPEGYKIKASESFWSYEESTGIMTISLDKASGTWWPCVVEGEPLIDTQAVDSTKAVHDYDDATQASIRKIMFDQQQKRKGLPTSNELSKEAILEKAKYLPGSPFLQQQ